jgi:hypothetical protein
VSRATNRNFHSFLGKGFGENTRIGNEQGIYWGLKIQPIRKLVFTSYFDLFNFPWLKYQVDSPSDGKDFMASATYSFNRNFNIRIQYRNKLKEMNLKDETFKFVRIEPKKMEKILLDLNYIISPSFSIKTRIQHTQIEFDKGKNSGFLIAQDINYSQHKFSLSTRFALFDTDNYDSRQFIYERDLLYVYSVPSFYSKGVRYYFTARYSVSRNISLWMKYAQTNYFDADKIGSGLEEIKGNTKSDVSFQVRIKL